jgi:hypothetical protein
MCVKQNQYQIINPTTQIALTSICIDNCLNLSSPVNIKWNIYYGLVNLTNDFIQWTILENKIQYINNWIFGKLFTINFCLNIE